MIREKINSYRPEGRTDASNGFPTNLFDLRSDIEIQTEMKVQSTSPGFNFTLEDEQFLAIPNERIK